MKPVQKISLALVVAIAALVIFLATRNRQPPIVPPDEEHASFIDAAACNECHGPEGPIPQSTNHPLGNECMRCHGQPK
jgi:cytochrome c553